MAGEWGGRKAGQHTHRAREQCPSVLSACQLVKHGAHERGESLQVSLIGTLAVSSLASGFHDCCEGGHWAVEYCAK